MLICEMSEGREGDTFFAQSHGAEDHFEVGLCLGWTEVIVHGDGDGRSGEGLGLSGGHFDCALHSVVKKSERWKVGARCDDVNGTDYTHESQ